MKGTTIIQPLTALLMIFLLMLSCSGEEKIVEVPIEVNYAPAPPTGVYSINLDGYVMICWSANYESDISHYKIYRAEDYDGPFEEIGTRNAEYDYPAEYCFEDDDFPDYADGVAEYFYAVRAFDFGGLGSDYSIEEVTATPRPEKLDSLYEHSYFPDGSGIDIYSYNPVNQTGTVVGLRQRDSLETTDFFFAYEENEYGEMAFSIVAYRPGVDIQDYGYVGTTVYDYDFLNYAPTTGWSPARKVEAILGHCYMLRLLESDGYHYMKLIIAPPLDDPGRNPLTPTRMLFYWAFQTDPENRNLTPALDDEEDDRAKAFEIELGRLTPPSLGEGSTGMEQRLGTVTL